MKSKKQNKGYSWTKDEDEYLIRNYCNTPNSTIIKVLNKKRDAISIRARKLGLSKGSEAKECSTGVKKSAYREETPLLADIICFYHRRKANIMEIAKDVHCPPEQVKEILERCMDNGMYEHYARLENGAIQFATSCPLNIRSNYRTSKRGAACCE